MNHDEGAYDLDRFDRQLHAVRASTGLSRRRALQLLSALGAGAALGIPSRRAFAQAAPPIHKPTPANEFRLLGTNAETLWEAYKGVGYHTPASLFFVRNHTLTPQIDASTWRLTVDGSGVRRPLSLSYDDLLALPAVTTTKFIERSARHRPLQRPRLSVFGRRQSSRDGHLVAQSTKRKCHRHNA